jgi:hypothetical protein
LAKQLNASSIRNPQFAAPHSVPFLFESFLKSFRHHSSAGNSPATSRQQSQNKSLAASCKKPAVSRSVNEASRTPKIFTLL